MAHVGKLVPHFLTSVLAGLKRFHSTGLKQETNAHGMVERLQYHREPERADCRPQ